MSYFSLHGVKNKRRQKHNSEKTRCSSAVNIIQGEKVRAGDAAMVADEACLERKSQKRKEKVSGVKT